jgi:hypothetical protein
MYKADFAGGHDVVTVVGPIGLDDYPQGGLEAELAALAPRPCASSWPTRCRSPRSAPTSSPRQAEREIDALKSMWRSR